MEVRRQSLYSDETKKMILRVGGATNTTVLFPDSTSTDKSILQAKTENLNPLLEFNKLGNFTAN